MGYLDQYGEGGERQEKIIKALAIGLLLTVAAGAIYYLFFRNWQEERQVRQFLSLLQAGQYEQAYEMWGCSVENPCRYYPYEEFLRDWGPDSSLGKVESFRLGRSYEQSTGVIITLKINGQPHQNLWVEKDTDILGFSPY